jgi:hypothetical protein
LYEVVSPFTRDFDALKSKLQQLDEYDKTCIETALHGVNRLVLGEWGSATPCQVRIHKGILDRTLTVLIRVLMLEYQLSCPRVSMLRQ